MSWPSHATAVAYLALFVALGGSAYAASQLPKNSVGTEQLKKNAVTTPKLKKNAVTGAKVDESTLAQVPSAASAGNATTAGHATTAGAATTAGHAATAGTATSAGHAATATDATTAAHAATAGHATDASTLGGIPSGGFLSSGDARFGSAEVEIPSVQTIVSIPGMFRLSTVGDGQEEFKLKFENTSSDLWYVLGENFMMSVAPGASQTKAFAPLWMTTLMAIDAADESKHAVVDCSYRSTLSPVISCLALAPGA